MCIHTNWNNNRMVYGNGYSTSSSSTDHQWSSEEERKTYTQIFLVKTQTIDGHANRIKLIMGSNRCIANWKWMFAQRNEEGRAQIIPFVYFDHYAKPIKRTEKLRGRHKKNCAHSLAPHRVHSYVSSDDIITKQQRISHTFEPVRHLIGRPFSHIYVSHFKLQQSTPCCSFDPLALPTTTAHTIRFR